MILRVHICTFASLFRSKNNHCHVTIVAFVLRSKSFSTATSRFLSIATSYFIKIRSFIFKLICQRWSSHRTGSIFQILTRIVFNACELFFFIVLWLRHLDLLLFLSRHLGLWLNFTLGWSNLLLILITLIILIPVLVTSITLILIIILVLIIILILIITIVIVILILLSIFHIHILIR